MQQDNNPKARSKSTTEWLQQKKIRLLEWPSQSPDLNPIEMLWHDLKRAVHTRHPKNIVELKQFRNEEWSKFLLTIVQVWSATTENVCLRFLLPNEGQPVIKTMGLHTFSNLHCECLHGVINKLMKNYNCLCVISLSRLCLSIVVTQMKISSDDAEVQVIPKGSHTFSWHCILPFEKMLPF